MDYKLSDFTNVQVQKLDNGFLVATMWPDVAKTERKVFLTELEAFEYVVSILTEKMKGIK